MREQAVRIGPAAADLTLPTPAVGLVLFVHGSGSSRHSPRNRAVAAALQAHGLGTLLLDLLSEAEAADRHVVFDIALLGRRVDAAIRWVDARLELADLPLGLFGASTGAAAALQAAAANPARVAAVVCRGGRPDLAADWLPQVQAPTRLIVGGLDTEVLALNRAALACMHGDHRIDVVPGASHLFEEAGTLEAVTRLATDWFQRHLTQEPSP
jgi:putative phosphoribosyl transferase